MKMRILTAIALFAALAAPVLLQAQEQSAQEAQQQKASKPQRYTVIDLGTLGGGFSVAWSVNDKREVDGASVLPGGEFRAFIWRNGVMSDLGTLGGPNSFANYKTLNESGEVVGVSEIPIPDPNAENFCGFGTGLKCVPFFWWNGVMTQLPLLGGNNGQAAAVNNRGQVAGGAENAILDTTCTPPRLQFLPVIWEKGQIHELPVVPGDTNGEAFAINDKGQAVGDSGICVPSPFSLFATGLHALLWQNGNMIELGSLGGTRNNYAFDINNQSQVVGVSDIPGDMTFHAFLWQRGVMSDLGTLPGDFDSQGYGINSKAQVVGESDDAIGDARAFLWQNGEMTDLNTLVRGGSSLFLLAALGINSRGDIAGIAFDTSTGEVHGFLATRSDGGAADETATPVAAAGSGERPKVVLPEDVRKLLRRHFGPFGRALVRPQ